MLKRSVETTRQVKRRQPAITRPAQVDERLSDRVAAALPLVYTLTTRDGRLEGRGRTINISGGGIRFLIPKPVASRTPCRLRLTLPNQPTPLSLRGVVVWSRRARTAGRSRYEVGVRLQTSNLADEAALAPYCQFIASQLLMKYAR